MGNYAKLLDAVKYYKNRPHQNDAWEALDASLSTRQRELFTQAYRSRPEGTEKLQAVGQLPFVPYFWQRDSNMGHGERMCQSSSIAMVIEGLKPGIVGGDDQYLEIVLKYGDTVSQSAHMSALDELGFEYEFRMDGSRKELELMLDAGLVVPIGVLHKGNISSPSGGGHWLVVIGQTKTDFICNDPFGKMDLYAGGYPQRGPTDGRTVLYNKDKLMKRWLISTDHDGWYWSIY